MLPRYLSSTRITKSVKSKPGKIWVLFLLKPALTAKKNDFSTKKIKGGGGACRVSYIFGPKILNSVLLILKMFIEG